MAVTNSPGGPLRGGGTIYSMTGQREDSRRHCIRHGMYEDPGS